MMRGEHVATEHRLRDDTEGATKMTVVTLQDLQPRGGTTGARIGSGSLGDMTVLSHVWPRGMDVTALLRAVCGEMLCPSPHYLFITKGSIGIRYTADQSEEIAHAGDAVYMPPGHTCWAIEDLEMVELSPGDITDYLWTRIAESGLTG
jgi:hypothetical protein